MMDGKLYMRNIENGGDNDMGWYHEVKELYKSIPEYELDELLQELSLSHLLPYFKGTDFSRKPVDKEWLILLKVAVAMGRIRLKIEPVNCQIKFYWRDTNASFD